MSAVQCPVAFGGGLRVVFGNMHCFTAGVECAMFETDLFFESVAEEKKDKEDDNTSQNSPRKGNKKSQIILKNPLSVPQQANLKDGTGIHQFAPTGDVVNTLTSKIEVQDLSISAGYTLML